MTDQPRRYSVSEDDPEGYRNEVVTPLHVVDGKPATILAGSHRTSTEPRRVMDSWCPHPNRLPFAEPEPVWWPSRGTCDGKPGRYFQRDSQRGAEATAKPR